MTQLLVAAREGDHAALGRFIAVRAPADLVGFLDEPGVIGTTG